MSTSNRLPFAGRTAQLEVLRGAWESVRAGPGPKVVVLLAESGLGKTRLVQEFYGWLVEHEQCDAATAAYWPAALSQDANNLHVNPAESSWDSSAALPFLWWGVRLSNPQGHNQVATGALAAHVQPFLVPHLEPFHREQRRRQRLLDVAKVGGAVAVDAVLDLVPVLGLLKKVGEVGLELKGIHDSWRRDQRVVDAAQDAAGRRASLVEQVITDLGTLFSGPGGRRVPAVIVVDDAQFSTYDPGMVEFVESLVAAMTEGDWPLLLLVTHWQREWDLSDAADTSVGPPVPASASLEPSIAAVLKRTRPTILDVVRLGPISDLAPALAARLPGLLPEQATTLLERIGGNPRFLDEVLRLVELQGRGVFVKRDQNGPLTDAGLKELLAASTGLHELIRNRLMQSPDEVQKAVVLAGLQGVEFLGAMVAQTAASLDEDAPAVDEAVAVAEQPHAYFAETFPGMRAFVQPIYQEVARQRLGYWYDVDEAEDALAEAVRATLRANPEMELHQIVALYELAVRLFEHSEDEADRLIAVKGLHWLAHVAESRRDMHAVRSLAQRQVALLRTVDMRLLPDAVEVLTSTDRFLGLFGELQARREVVDTLVRVTREVAAVAVDGATVPDAPGLGAEGHTTGLSPQTAHVAALVAAAEVHDAAGDRAATRAYWAAALAAAETISAPDDHAPTLEVLCAVYRKHATWLLGLMETAEAEQGYRAALMLLDRLGRLQSERSRSAEALACRQGLAKVYRVTGRADESEELLRVALRAARASALEERSFATANGLAATLDDLAQTLMLRAGGPTTEATELLRESLSVSRGHLEALPGVQWPLLEVASKLETLAMDAARRSDGDEAWELVQEAVALRRSSRGATDPGPARWNLAVCLYRAGDIAAYRADVEVAAANLRQALVLFRAEAEAGTTGELEAAYFRLSAIVLLAPIEMRRDDYAGARALLEEADSLNGVLPGIIPAERVDPLWRHVADHWALVVDHEASTRNGAGGRGSND